MGFNDVPSVNATIEEENIVECLVNNHFCQSKREAREFITNGAISINGNQVKDLDYVVSKENAIGNKFNIIRRGKKNYFLIRY